VKAAPTHHRQRGAALLIALVGVALALLLATELIQRSQRDLARTQALVDAERGWQLAAGLDGLAREWIRQQRDAGVAARALDGLWSEWFPVPGGAVRGRIFDLSGRFNLNALAAPDAVEAVRARQAFERVADSLALERTLVDAILALYAPGADARRLTLAHLSELDALPGMNPTRRRTLEAILTVLPDPAARLNLNWAAPETLAAWLDGLSLQQAEALIARGPWNELDAVLAQPELVGLPQVLLRQRLAVDSRWYLAQAQVVLDGEPRDYFRLVGDGASGYDFRYFSLGIP